MAKIIYDGKEYEIPQDMTPRELGLVKRVSGVRGGELDDALNSGDVEAIVAILHVAAARAGDFLKIDDLLDDRDFGDKLDFEDEDEDEEQEDEENPPAEADAEAGSE